MHDVIQFRKKEQKRKKSDRESTYMLLERFFTAREMMRAMKHEAAVGEHIDVLRAAYTSLVLSAAGSDAPLVDELRSAIRFHDAAQAFRQAWVSERRILGQRAERRDALRNDPPVKG